VTFFQLSFIQIPEELYFLAVSLRNINRLDEAKKNLDKVVELNPNWLAPHRMLAQLHLVSGDDVLAFAQSEKILYRQAALLTSFCRETAKIPRL
jgi:tetratricopeptide (TPR) repeat protein